MFLTPKGLHRTATEAAEAFRPPWDSSTLRDACSRLYDGDRLILPNEEGWVVRLSGHETSYDH